MKSEEVKIKTRNIWIVIILIILIAGIIYAYVVLNTTGKENKLYKTILKAESETADVSVTSQTALSYYESASLSYEKNDYTGVETNCKLARDSFTLASQGYLNIASELSSSGIKDKLLDIYTEELQTLSDININLYEACEHFESASRYYDTYYNTNVPSTDSSYTMANQEIDAMNQKIDLHDANVKKYNGLLADFTAELKKRLQ